MAHSGGFTFPLYTPKFKYGSPPGPGAYPESEDLTLEGEHLRMSITLMKQSIAQNRTVVDSPDDRERDEVTHAGRMLCNSEKNLANLRLWEAAWERAHEAYMVKRREEHLLRCVRLAEEAADAARVPN
jgi:hypothetical protein